MALFKRNNELADRLKAVEKAIEPVNKVNSEVEEKGFMTQLQTQYDSWRAPKRYSRGQTSTKNVDWLSTIVDLIGNYVSDTPLHLYVKTDIEQESPKNYKTKKLNCFEKKSIDFIGDSEIEEIFGHPAQDLLRSVNSYTDGFSLFANTENSIDIVGDGYWYIVKKDGVPIEIHQLDPNYMTVIPNREQTAILGYKYNTSEGTVSFDVDEIVRFSNNTYESRWYGISPIMKVAGMNEFLLESKDFEYSLLKNTGIPPAIIRCKQKIDPKQQRTLENQWRKGNLGTSRNSVKVLSGDVEIEKIGLSIEELMLGESKIWNLKGLAAAYAVPMPLLDAMAQKGGINSNDDMYVRMLAQQCIKPRLKKIEQVLNQQYVQLFDDSGRLFFKFDNPVPIDDKEEAEIAEIYVKNGIMTKNEARAQLGLPPLEEVAEEVLVEEVIEDTDKDDIKDDKGDE